MSRIWATARVALDPQGMLLLAALADSGGARKAAAALGVPRSTVTRRLAQLEAEVAFERPSPERRRRTRVVLSP